LVVVGSAGERDPGKRAPLGEAAVRGADVAVLTEEDSRSEDVSAILAAMARGAEAAGGVRGETFHLEPDRREAIALAYRLARPGDVVVLAGKGHERTLERADETVPWDEAATARELLPPGAARGRGRRPRGSAAGPRGLPAGGGGSSRPDRLARPGDVVGRAGKGHERTLGRADEPVPWDEAATARELLPPGAA